MNHADLVARVEGALNGEIDGELMRRALVEAERGRGLVEPNPLVGAVVWDGAQVVGVGFHARCGGPHAEVAALANAGANANGAVLYVTLEPCAHHGKTPPCTEAVIASGIERVVAATRDPNPQVAGGGCEVLRAAGVEVEVGVLADEAKRLNAPFFKRVLRGRPYVVAKWAMTLDGRTATSSGDSRWISNAHSRGRVHALRGRVDAILVGIGTALVDDPLLTARPAGPRLAARVVLDSAARLPLDSQLVRTARAIPCWVAVDEHAPAGRVAALEAAGCIILPFSGLGGIPIPPLLDELGRLGVTNLLVEGGGRALGSFLDAGEVDAVEVFIAPAVVGGPPTHLPTFGHGRDRIADALRLERRTFEILDGDLHLSGTFRHPWLDDF